MEESAAKELYYQKTEVKACLNYFTRQQDQALRKSEQSIHDGYDDTHWIKVNTLNTIDSFMSEGVEVFGAKDLDKIYLEIISEDGIQYKSNTSRFAFLLTLNNDDLDKRNISSKVITCCTACVDREF